MHAKQQLKNNGSDFFFSTLNQWDAAAAVECILLAGYQSMRKGNYVYYASDCPDWLLQKAANINTL